MKYEVALSAPALAYLQTLDPRMRAKLAYSLQTELVNGPNDHLKYSFDYSGEHYYTALPLSFNAIIAVFRELTRAELDRLRKERRIRGPMPVGFLVIDFLSPESGIYLRQEI